MRHPASIALFCLCISRCFSQEQPSQHSLSLEGLGIAQYGSVNYEFFFNQQEKRFLAFRIGLGFSQAYDESVVLTLPHGLTVNFGSKNYFETGVYGGLPLKKVESTGFVYPSTSVYSYYYLGPMFGYRRQSSKGFFRTFLAAYYVSGPYNYLINGGAAFGFRFR